MRAWDTLQGFLNCIHRCCELLAKHLPATGSKDELAHHLMVLE